jgi:signal transduction histidine kinase
MYRRLIVFGLAVCAAALLALVIPLGLAARDIVQAQQLSAAANTARAVADEWQQQGGDHGETMIAIPATDGPGSVTLYGPKGAVEGPNPPAAQQAVQAALRGGSVMDVVDGRGYATTPAYFDDTFGAVLVELSPDELNEGLAPRLAGLAGVSVLMLGLAAAAAWWLARRTVAPLRDLEHTANAVAAGELDARAPASTITEIDNVGVALNRVTERVQELLKEEREYTAELAHQLRTPLTALSVDVDAVPDPAVREQLQDDVTAVNGMVDEIITTARRSSREGLRAGCDATEVVRARVLFWNVLAEDQRRDFSQEIPDAELPVRLMADDLSSALDILFQNVFLHTPEGRAFGVRVEATDGFVDVTVWDRGDGFDVSREREAVGSTQLGLSIASRLAQASGGRLLMSNAPDGGAVVTLRLGPPAR